MKQSLDLCPGSEVSMVSAYSKRCMVALGLGVMSFMVASGSARACNVPVFRYALERWQAEPYRVVLFHRGPLTGKDKRALEHLEQFGRAGKRPPILTIDPIDLDKPTDGRLLETFKRQGKGKLPWAMVFYPQDRRLDKPLWAGPLDGDVVDRLVSSPIREAIATRILRGESAVALFLESGNKKRDDKAVAVLEASLKGLSKKLGLPKPGRAGPPAPLGTEEKYGPVRIAFSMIRVSRGDAKERLLVQMLQHSEAHLPTDEPMVYFLYGQGRALLPLVGAGITAENIEEAAGFLCGPCACVFKRENPGFGLLFDVDWAAGPPLEPEERREVRDLIGRLGSESFAEREKAARRLEGKGPRVAGLLRAHGLTSSDPEVRSRCRRILAKFAGPSGS